MAENANTKKTSSSKVKLIRQEKSVFNKKSAELTTTDYMDMCTYVQKDKSHREGAIYTSSTALMHPSFSGLLVTCAYLPHTTLPEGVTWLGLGLGLGLGLRGWGCGVGVGVGVGVKARVRVPEGVTRPRSEQLTSMMVPLVITPG